MPASGTRRTALVVGASRAIGLALAAELLRRGWDVVGTVRGADRTALHDLADDSAGHLVVETLDMTAPDQITALRERLSGRVVDLLFVNAGITHENLPVGEVSTESFTEVMVTNALAPLRVIETLRPIVATGGTIGVMSSRQGSLTMNTTGGHEVYRASKSALNQLVRSYAARTADDPRTLLLIHPGWVRTGLGGSGAPLEIDDVVPGVVDVLEKQAGTPGLQFLDHRGEMVAW